jgi:hypothetical protein
MNTNKDQTYLVNELTQACKKADLSTVKDLINKISFELPYNGSAYAKEIFLAACESNDLDTIKFLVDHHTAGDYVNLSQNISTGLKIAVNNQNRNYDVIRYLEREPKLSRVLYLQSRLPAKAAYEDNLEFLDAVLDLNDTSKYNLYMWPKLDIIEYGCNDGNSFVIKHFFNTPNLKNVLDPILTFKEVCELNNHELLSFFIFDLNIQKTEQISEIIKENEDAKKMFTIRDLNSSLAQELDDQEPQSHRKLKM